MKYIFLIISTLFSASTFSQESKDSVQVNGNSHADSLFMAQKEIDKSALTTSMGDSAYLQEDYVTAAEIYETILEEGRESAALYYNLGNAYYKMNRVAKSILNYERSLLLDPSNKDVRFNLELARHKMVDKINPKGEFFIAVWLKGLIGSFSADVWAICGIVSFAVFIISILAYVFSKRLALKKIGFIVGIFSFVVALSANLFAFHQQDLLVNRRSAVVMEPSVTVKSTPSGTGTDLFILHEGHKVEIIDNTMRGWKEIEIEDGNVGWIPVETIEII